MRSLAIVVVLAAPLLATCGGDKAHVVTDGDSDVDADTDGDTDTGAIECTESGCPTGLVCDPKTGLCTDDDVPCQDHGDCIGGSVCVGDLCVPNDRGGPCASDANCVDDETCLDGFCGCGGESYGAENVPSNVLIALDRSGSMDESVPGFDGGNDTKWNVAREAVNRLLDGYADQVRFGLMLWPGTNQSCSEGVDCGAGAVLVDVGDGTADAIRAMLSGASLCSFGTPIGATVDSLVDYAGLQDPTRGNYVLLMTDGNETCGGDGVGAVQTLLGEDPSVGTFVVGFGAGVDPDLLDEMAREGGVPRVGDPAYYQANDGDSLEEAFAAIAGSVLSCTYDLDEVPPDADELYIYFDREEVSRDVTHGDGWDYDPATNQVTFYGAACGELQSGSVQDLVIVYGCPLVII